MTVTQEQIAEYEEQGYLIVRGLFRSKEITPLRQELLEDPTVGGARYGMTGDTPSLQHVCFWTECGDDLIGTIPRLERMAATTSALLGDESYHWHSKFVVKPPGSTRGRWHQDFGSWYDDGVPHPNMLTVAVAVSESTRGNGCTMVVPGSHHAGRLDPPQQEGAEEAFQARLEFAVDRLGVVYGELQPGDTMFFHSNVLHASGANESDDDRVVMFVSYNARSNAPIEGAVGLNEAGAYMNIAPAEREYRPLRVVPDDSLTAGSYRTVFGDTPFRAPKMDLPDNYTRAVALTGPMD